jgi:hypothetical protein
MASKVRKIIVRRDRVEIFHRSARQAGNSAKVLQLSELVHGLLSAARSPPRKHPSQRGLWPCVLGGCRHKRSDEIRGISVEDGKLIHAYRWRRLSVIRLRPGGGR